MFMEKNALRVGVFMFLLFAPTLFAAGRVEITVSQSGSADFKTIKEAVNHAQPGDIITILDVATYKEQVDIDSNRNGITLRSKDPKSLAKPTIQFQDQIHVGPRTATEAKNDSLIDFDRNGALRILGAHNILIEGIAVDGVEPFAFGYPAIWNGKDALQHGNAAITIWVSGNCIVRNCDLKNAYIGINFKDRNLGGIFANPNPADLDTQNNVPLSQFGRTGNHVVEFNRIHDNSWGIFFESSWDMGSTVRFNLFYENHHPTEKFGSSVKTLTSQEGGNQVGGAMMFKDVQLSPVAIYNNTFWRNFALMAGNWQAGYHHLVFNNIFGPPYHFWQNDANFTAEGYLEMTQSLINRMYHCILSAQKQAPEDYSVQIMDGVSAPTPAGGGVIAEGCELSPPFPSTANIRWIQMTDAMFLSTNPTSASFLEPDWSNSVVSQYISKQGWPKSGVKNSNTGEVADIGAIQQGAGQFADLITIRPTMPISFNGSAASLQFAVEERIGKIQSPTLTNMLFRFVGITYEKGSFGGAVKTLVLPAGATRDLTVPATPVKVGANSYTVTIPGTVGDYAFVEMIIEGVGSDGKKFSSAVGFIPYRKLDYKFVVEIWDKAKAKKLDAVRAGDSVVLRIIPQKISGAAFTGTVKPADVNLQSGFKLLISENPEVEITYPNGITGQTDQFVIFTRIPPPDGIEYVNASGIWTNNTGGGKQVLPFLGFATVKVLAGPPAKVEFIDPPSNSRGLQPPILNVGFPYPGTLIVYDKYKNPVNEAANVVVQSLTPTTANIVGGKPDTTIKTDSTGVGNFKVLTTNQAQKDDLVRLEAKVAGVTMADTANMLVGERAEHLFIFYSDLAGYNPETRLEGQVGDRLMVTIIATKSLNPTIDSILTTGWDVAFTVSGNSSLLFYSSQDAQTPTTSYTLVNGRATVWVSSMDSLNNAQMATQSDLILRSEPRDHIYFTRPIVTVDSAFYFANNGFGRADSVEIYLRNKITMIPDSLILYWPTKDSFRLLTGKNPAMRLSADSLRISIILASNPFPAEVTAAKTTEKLGAIITRPNDKPGVPSATLPFYIRDRVGPLLLEPAQVVERVTPGPGTDTMYITFSELIKVGSIQGATLQLIQSGMTAGLTVTQATPLGSNRWKIVVTSSVRPEVGDSLKITPNGPLMDSLGNFAHLLNRPIPIRLKTVLPGIVAAYYIDNEGQRADGIVDTVIIAFNKKVILSELHLSLEWTGSGVSNRADDIATGLLSFRNSRDTIIGVSVRGQFLNLGPDAIRTSGGMNASFTYASIPGETGTHDVTDSAAPVVVDSALFRPAPRPEDATQTRAPDTLYVSFSEAKKSTVANTTPFFSQRNTPGDYTITLVSTLDEMTSDNPNKVSYRFIVGNITSADNSIDFPKNGDSLWINPTALIMDANSSTQDNPNNRKVPMHVFPIPYNYRVLITRNPFDPGIDHETKIKIVADTKVRESVNLQASARLFDALGNCMYTWEWKAFNPNLSNDTLSLDWNGYNNKNRRVGSGVYVVHLSIKKDGVLIDRPILKKIGVKR